MKNVGVYLAFAFVMVVSSAAYAAEDMIPSEYYKTVILGRRSGVYEYQDKLFIHSKAAFNSKNPSAKSKAKLDAMLGTSEVLRKWAIDYTEKDRGEKKVLSSTEQFIKGVLDKVDDRWQFPDWEITSSLQCVMNGRHDDEYVVGMCGDKQQIISLIPSAYRMPCDAKTLREAAFSVTKRFAKGSQSMRFARMCGAWDIVGMESVNSPDAKEFRAFNVEVAKYLQEAQLAKELREEAASMSEPQIVTNRTLSMNAQGTEAIEKIEIVTTRRFPRMQQLFLDEQNETNFPTARLESGVKAIASLSGKNKIGSDEQRRLFKVALCESPGDKELWNFYGRLLRDAGDFYGAIICFRNAHKLDSKFVYPIVNLAVTYKLLGKDSLAIGLALFGCGMAEDNWSVSQLNSILWNVSDSGMAIQATENASSKSNAITNAPVKDKSQTEVLPDPDKKIENGSQRGGQSVRMQSPRGFSSSEVDTKLDF